MINPLCSSGAPCIGGKLLIESVCARSVEWIGLVHFFIDRIVYWKLVSSGGSSTLVLQQHLKPVPIEISSLKCGGYFVAGSLMRCGLCTSVAACDL